jgi:glycosyltransferase involved in cell wall biosynthesis
VRIFLEGLVLTQPVGAFPRAILRRLAARRLAILASCFDEEFYLSQFEDSSQRLLVSRDPLLHYALLGWCAGRSPAPSFDPDFYRRYNVGTKIGDPLLHCLTRSRIGRPPTNEADANGYGISSWQPGRPSLLVFNHPRGGGSSRFLDLYLADPANRKFNILLARAVRHAPALTIVQQFSFDLGSERQRMVRFARSRGVARILINHLIDRPVAMMKWVSELSAQLGIPYDVILHDYYVLCPRVDLVTGDGTFCGIASPEVCQRCVEKYGAELRKFDALSWRDDHLAFLEGADRIVVPSDDIAGRLQPYVKRSISVWCPEDDLRPPPETTPRLSADEPLRVAVLGALNVSKGLRVVQQLAEVAQRTGAPLSLSIIGPTSEGLPASVSVTGPYRPEQLDQLIADAAPHVMLFPAIWPETWSFVLTEGLRRGLPVVAFDFGAPAARLRALGRGHLLPLALSKSPERLLAELLRLRESYLS